LKPSSAGEEKHFEIYEAWEREMGTSAAYVPREKKAEKMG